MPPKVSAPVKGQSSLFSFFKKPATAALTPSTATTPTTVQLTQQKNDDGQHTKLPTVSPSAATPSEKNEKDQKLVEILNDSSSKRKGDISVNKSTKSALKGKKARVIKDEEAEWDEEEDALKDTDESEEEREESGSEFDLSSEDESADSADDDSDDFLVDSDESDEDYGSGGGGKRSNKKGSSSNKRQKLRKGPTTSTPAGKAPKLPPSGRKTPAASSSNNNSDNNNNISGATPKCMVTPAYGSHMGSSSGNFLNSSSASRSGGNRLVTPESTNSSSSNSNGQGMFFGSATKTPASSYGNSASSSPAVSSADASSTTGKALLALPEGVLGQGSHEHNFLPFLQKDAIRDHMGRPPSHPDYNPRTLKVPTSHMKEQTPAMHQWWEFKSMNMDTVLFFKVGKFYELFHMDADVGFTELDLVYMKGTKGHSGFPEIAYGKFSSALVEKGYRVARVEQTETPDMLKERNAMKGGTKDKVVAREVCAVMSKGTRTYCHLDDLSLLDDPVTAFDKARSVTISIKEIKHAPPVPAVSQENADKGDDDDDNDDYENTTRVASEYGICCVDTVIGTLTLAQFADDEQRSRLRTMLAKYSPSEVLLERPSAMAGTDGDEVRENSSAETMGVIKLVCPRACVDWLHPRDEMLSAEATVDLLKTGQYFGEDGTSASGLTEQEEVGMPPILKAVTDGAADGSSALALSAFGGVLWQLKRSFIDYDVLSLRKVFAYVPPDNEYLTTSANAGAAANTPFFVSQEDDDGADAAAADSEATADDAGAITTPSEASASASASASADEPRSMVLDEIALSNLEILVNNHDRSEKGSLWSFVNKCKTDFGRRLLRSWLCNPLYRARDIQRRSAAVEELISSFPEECERARGNLHNLPDLERLLSRVHVNGLRKRGTTDHPDSRAIMYEMTSYNKRKIKDFSDVLNGFERVLTIGKIFSKCEVSSPLLALCVKSAPTEEEEEAATSAMNTNTSRAGSRGRFPTAKMESLLQYFRRIFDERQAKADGCIKPRPGVHPAYDEAKADVMRLESEFEQYLREMKRETGISDMKYFGSNKDRYQIEVPMGMSNRVPRDWSTKSQKKTHRRYWTAAIEQRLELLVDAEARAAAAQLDTLRSVFERFDANTNVWGDALTCVSMLDALQSLAQVSSLPGYVWPTVVSPTEAGGPVLDIQGGRHPMLEVTLSKRGDGDYIPNDVSLGGVTTNSVTGQTDYTARTMLLSGPNMGGKSTLLRQTCLIAIMAQIGCKIPADACTISPVDRIFTRVGASDRILAGQSTFFVELAETAMILKCATRNSLCILDELGRGTATFDGTAIAHAVVEHIVSRSHSRCLFATHYHSLVDDWEFDPRVKLGHMDCIVAPSANDDGDSAAPSEEEEDQADSSVVKKSSEEANSKDVLFLYKLCDGSSPRSYGINVARLAGLPLAVIELAKKQSAEFEEKIKAAAATAGSTMTGSVLNRNVVASVVERLVSVTRNWEGIEHPAASPTAAAILELTYVAKEMWRRAATYAADALQM